MTLTCEFCTDRIPGDGPENLTLLAHLSRNDACRRQFEHLLENIRTSWTPAMSGG